MGSSRAAVSGQGVTLQTRRRSSSSSTARSGSPMSSSTLAPKIRLFQGDAVEWLRSLPSNAVDLVVTDPPYESLEKHRAVGTTTRLKQSKASSNQWFSIFPNSRFPELFQELFRVLKPDRHLYLFCDPETAFVAKPAGESAGFKFWKPLVWDKVTIGMGYHYRARYEFVLFFEKGKRKLADLGVPDIIRVPRVRNGYPTEKPVDVSSVLVAQSTSANEIVCDPFMGSASTGVAAVVSGRNFWGADLAAATVAAAQTRLLERGATVESEPMRRHGQQRLLW